MKKINICGVPEHFNLPWHLCIENNEFQKENLEVKWTDVPEGTGKMCQMLRESQTDIAVILTEGIIKDIIAGNPSKIVQIYVQSPLVWGIHVAAKSNFYELSDLENKKIAISRLGSGSQLMAFVNAKNQGWNTQNLEFEIVNTIDGAVESLTNGKSDYFMWEHLMTKPLVDQGIFRKIADCPTPWPCFVIAVREEFLQKEPKIIEKILKIINLQTLNFKKIPNIADDLSQNFNLKKEDIISWLSQTEWSQDNISEQTLTKIQNQLFELKIIDKMVTFANLVKAI